MIDTSVGSMVITAVPVAARPPHAFGYARFISCASNNLDCPPTTNHAPSVVVLLPLPGWPYTSGVLIAVGP